MSDPDLYHHPDSEIEVIAQLFDSEVRVHVRRPNGQYDSITLDYDGLSELQKLLPLLGYEPMAWGS